MDVYQTSDYLQDAITLLTLALDKYLSFHDLSFDEVSSLSELYQTVPIKTFIMNISFIGKTVCVQVTS